ncbi:MAG: ethanolamine ammonia-lyase subunit EutC [Lentisphaerota bacterium]
MENIKDNKPSCHEGKICDELSDISEINIRKQLLVPNPANKKAYMELKEHTPARIGVWRCGPRYKTETLLRFRADHAAAQDAVFTNVDEKFITEMNLFTVQSKCKTKDEYITRPDLGKQLSQEAISIIKEKCVMKPQVQIYVSDGLSSVAIEANLENILPAMIQGLKIHRISVGTPFFVKYGRVRTVDDVSDATGAEVVCNLIGERPGLITAESMSAYIVYKAFKGMPEARMTVVSNIHRQGMRPTEAGAYIADVINTMLEKKASGVDLKL